MRKSPISRHHGRPRAVGIRRGPLLLLPLRRSHSFLQFRKLIRHLPDLGIFRIDQGFNRALFLDQIILHLFHLIVFCLKLFFLRFHLGYNILELFEHISVVIRNI